MTILDMQSALVIPVDIGGDMSASRRSPGYCIGNASTVTLDASWPATGSPEGAIKLELFNDPEATSGKAHDAFAKADVIAGQPSGGAGTLMVDRMRTGAAYACVSYTATAGGTGATPTITLSLKRS